MILAGSRVVTSNLYVSEIDNDQDLENENEISSKYDILSRIMIRFRNTPVIIFQTELLSNGSKR